MQFIIKNKMKTRINNIPHQEGGSLRVKKNKIQGIYTKQI